MSTAKKGLKRGYYVKGQFVAEGSEMDMLLKSESMGSKTKRKAEENAKQDFGAHLLTLNAKQLKALNLPERVLDAITEAKRIDSHEAKRRQMQFIGKLLRQVDTEALERALNEQEVTERLPEQAASAAPDASALWTEQLLADDEAVKSFIAEQPQTDTQQLRSLVRQARKLALSAKDLQNAQPPQPDKAYAEHQAAKKAAQKLQQFVKTVLGGEAE